MALKTPGQSPVPTTRFNAKIMIRINLSISEARQGIKQRDTVYPWLSILALSLTLALGAMVVVLPAPAFGPPNRQAVATPRIYFKAQVAPETSLTQPAQPEKRKQMAPKEHYKLDRLDRIIFHAAVTHQVDPALIKAIILAESGFNPRAVSKRGAMGLMQLMPITVREFGLDDVFDPAVNIEYGVRYFRKLLDRFDGDVKLALAAYNAGTKYVLKYKGIPPFKATRKYIAKVLYYHRLFSETLATKTGTGRREKRA